MPSGLLRSGTFAKLCRTTKDTLYFYEEAGLLQPRRCQLTVIAATAPRSTLSLT